MYTVFIRKKNKNTLSFNLSFRNSKKKPEVCFQGISMI